MKILWIALYSSNIIFEVLDAEHLIHENFDVVSYLIVYMEVYRPSLRH